jgi:DNA-binding MarR family transcriptional regulator
VEKSLILTLAKQSYFRVLRCLLQTRRLQPESQRHLRDIAESCELSVSGVSDVLRRLKKEGLLRISRKKNKKYFELCISHEERSCLENLFSLYERIFIRERAKQFSTHALQKFLWMDAAFEDAKRLREAKKNFRKPC